jgi:hypothetical protein
MPAQARKDPHATATAIDRSGAAMRSIPGTARPTADLVRAAQAGERRALDELVAGEFARVYNVVGRALNGHADVDDVVQETLVRVSRFSCTFGRGAATRCASRSCRPTCRTREATSPRVP